MTSKETKEKKRKEEMNLKEMKLKYFLLAIISEKEERYDLTIKQMKSYFNNEIYNKEYNKKERNLFFGSYKNILRQKRNSRRLLINEKNEMKNDNQSHIKKNLECKEDQNDNTIDEIDNYDDILSVIDIKFKLQLLIKLNFEISSLCHEVLEIVNNIQRYCLNISQEYFIYLNVVKADYYRYLCEISTGVELQKFTQFAQHCYFQAFQHASQQSAISSFYSLSISLSNPTEECFQNKSIQQSLSPLHPTILGLVLNYTVFLSEIMNDTEKALQLSREVFSDGN